MKLLSIALVNFSCQLSKNQIKINILTNSYFKMYQNVAFNVYSLFKILNLNRQFFNNRFRFNESI
jgi:hypothetical protein